MTVAGDGIGGAWVAAEQAAAVIAIAARQRTCRPFGRDMCIGALLGWRDGGLTPRPAIGMDCA